jgi:threonine/homoserine efflux transporter RhtA
VRGRLLVQILIFAVVAAALGYIVLGSADGWADWVVFGVVVMAALGGALAVWQRQYPAATQKRTFTRDSDSKW